MGRGNVRSSAATSASARNKWYQQTIKRNDTGKKPWDQKYFEGKKSSQFRSRTWEPPKRSLQRTDRGSAANRRYQTKKLRQQALREAQRQRLSPTEAKTYVTKRVRELQKRDRARENRRQIAREAASRKRAGQMTKSFNREKYRGFDSREELMASVAGRPSRDKRAEKKMRERVRQRARRRAQGAKTRSLQSLRRVTPENPYLRPARRRRQNLTNKQRLQNQRRGIAIARRRNWAQAKREGLATDRYDLPYNSNSSEWGYDIKL